MKLERRRLLAAGIVTAEAEYEITEYPVKKA